MYLSKVVLKNWRSYADAEFAFDKPQAGKPIVLIGAMNGHGKTSLLVSLYLGLYGRFGLQYCEGFSIFQHDDNIFYRKAIQLFRRISAPTHKPTVVDLTFSKTLADGDEKEIRIKRSWFFNTDKQPKISNFEEVQLYVDDKLVELDSVDIIEYIIETLLFPAHILPAFFFDGEQAQAIINKSGEHGIIKAVEVQFGTHIFEDVHKQIKAFISKSRNISGSKKTTTKLSEELKVKVNEREKYNSILAQKGKELTELEELTDNIEQEKREYHERLSKYGADKSLNPATIIKAHEDAFKELTNAQRNLTESSRSLGLSLGLSRLAIPISNQLKAEEVLENWDRLKRGTKDRANEVLAVAMPEPPETDPLLGHLSQDTRDKVKNRFTESLELIYNPPPKGCADRYIFPHIKGDLRQYVIDIINNIRTNQANGITKKTKVLKRVKDDYEETSSKIKKLNSVPEDIRELSQKLIELNDKYVKYIRNQAIIDNEIKKLKSDQHIRTAEIGRIQEEIAKLEPHQKRIAIAERINLVLDDLVDQLKPLALNQLEQFITDHFTRTADEPLQNGRIVFHNSNNGDCIPTFVSNNAGISQTVSTMSGFERRTFGIAFSLALTQVSQRRFPLIIDTPLGNADSIYRERLLKGLIEIDLDQIIILTHDQEVYGEFYALIKDRVNTTFLISKEANNEDPEDATYVYKNRYFEE